VLLLAREMGLLRLGTVSIKPAPAKERVKKLAQLRRRHSGTPLGGPGTYENDILPVSQNAVCLGSGLAGNARAPE
jgi:hypothetical protein